MSQPPPWDPHGLQGQQPYPGEQYGPSGAQPPQDPRQPSPGWYPDPDGQQVLRWWSGMGWTPHTQPLPGLQPSAGPAPAAQPQPAGHRSRNRGGSHWVRNILTVIGGLAIAAVIISLLSHASSGGSGSSGPCTSNSCIASDAEGLKGTVAKDNSVMTKVTCQASTAKEVVSGTYTVDCAVTYSDGSVWDGIASVLTGSGDIDWEPTSMVSAGNSGD